MITKPKQQKKHGRVKSAVLNWLGVPLSLVDSDSWSAAIGSTSDSGIVVNERSMLSLSAVWACSRLISETIATLPLSMYEKTTYGKQVALQHPLQTVIHDQPNADSTASVYWEAVIAAMLLRGVARSEKLMVGDRVVGLAFLAPCRLSVTRKSDGNLQYQYTELNGQIRNIPASKIFTIPGFSLDGVNGVSVISYGANVFGSALSASQAANKTFENGLMPTTYFKMERVLQKAQREEFRDNLAAVTGAINAGKSPLLEGGMTADTIGINPNDAQLLESRAFSVEEICRWFRVPPFMVGHSEKSTSWGTGIEQQMIGFLTFTLAPWLKRIEQSIAKDLLSPVERMRYYPKYSVEGLLRADSAGRSAFYSSMVNNGIFTRDECRELEDRAPFGGNADVLTVQTSMAPLDTIGTNTSGV